MVVKKINGYKYQTIEDFEADELICNNAKGFPAEANETQTFISFDINKDVEGNILFYYVSHFEELTELIGSPVEIDINIFE